MGEPRTLLAVNETASLLGIARGTTWRLIRNGELPVIRIGGRTKVHPDDLDDFGAARRERRNDVQKERDPAGQPSLATTSAIRGRHAES